jgi:hypothetical protein
LLPVHCPVGDPDGYAHRHPSTHSITSLQISPKYAVGSGGSGGSHQLGVPFSQSQIFPTIPSPQSGYG